MLDFIGGAHRKFRFDARYRALLGGTRKSIMGAIEHDFPQLPSGCVIQLDRQAREAVLNNIRDAIGTGRRFLAEDLKALGNVDLSTFLDEGGFELEDVYDGRGSWSDLRRKAGVITEPPEKEDQVIERAFGRMLHLDDFQRLDGLRDMVAAPTPPPVDETSALQRMLYVLLGQMGPFADMQHTFNRLWQRAFLRQELSGLLGVLEDRNRRVTLKHDTPLRTHASYTRLEVMAAFDERTKKGGVKKTQTGVYHLSDQQLDLFFVTLRKSESGFTATTMYRDYPISRRRFHWESQSACHDGTPTGRRYTKIGGANRALLLVREAQKDERGVAMPYLNLGEVTYLGHEGARPMRIRWELREEMPAEFYQRAKVAAG